MFAVPVGMLLGHTGRGGGFTVALSNVSRAVPTLALLTIFAVTPIGFGPTATTIALAVFAIPPILTNTYVGFRGVDRDVVEASRAMGFSEWQVARRVELPLAAPLLMTGVRTAAVQVVATATLAALVAGGGLGPHHHPRLPPAGLRRRPGRGDPGRRARRPDRAGAHGVVLGAHARPAPAAEPVDPSGGPRGRPGDGGPAALNR